MCSVAWAELDIPSDKILTKEEQKQVKEYLKGKINPRLTPAKNDYKNEYDRGTVELSECSNFSYQKVLFLDGEIIKNKNFSQLRPNTVISTAKNLIFERCNLVNVYIDPSWTLIDCNKKQKKLLIKSTKDTEYGKEIILSHQTWVKDKWVDAGDEKLEYDNKHYQELESRISEQDK